MESQSSENREQKLEQEQKSIQNELTPNPHIQMDNQSLNQKKMIQRKNHAQPKEK